MLGALVHASTAALQHFSTAPEHMSTAPEHESTGAPERQRPAVIVALGDSTTAGTPLFKSPIESPPNGAGNQESQFSFWLMKRHPGWTVLNRGVNGERTDHIAARFDRDVVAAKPAVVIILAGVNDVYQGRSVTDVTSQLRAMYGRAAAAGIPVVAGSIVPYNTATEEQNAKMRDINKWIAAEAARDANIEFADTRAAAAAPGQPDRLAGSPDGLHPDVAGYKAMAEALEPALVKMVR
ncbi:MAG TPA: GDSL-type esterase/lipase family protein [Vicinamibacterales bacterium]|nr:GDSL-type esterase/lipase family protein [Vicinamibacterales bacterium]